MRKLLVASLLALAWSATSATAATINFIGSFAVDYNSSDPGLVVQVNPSNGNLDFLLNPPVSTTFGLFDVWTNETTVNADDMVASPISVAFHFDAPPPPFGGDVGGSTSGDSFLLFGFIDIQYGSVVWNGPLLLPFGPNGDGLLQIALSDAIFSPGVFGLGNLPGLGNLVANIEGTFTLLNAPSVVTHAPIPPAIALFGTALAMAGGGSWWRRRSRASQDDPARESRD